MKAAFGALLLGWALAWAPAGAMAQAEAARSARESEAEAKLAALKRRVAALADAQKRAEGEKAEALVALRAADAAVAAAQAAVVEAAAEESRRAQAVAAKQAERDAVAATLASQREALAQLVRAAYAQGQHEQLKLLLAQDQMARLSRTLADYRHLQQARAERVRAVLADLHTLAALTAEVEAGQAEAAVAAAEAQAALAALETQREARRGVLAGLEAKFKDREARIAALGRDQRAIEALLAELRDAIADVPRQLDDDRPFAARRGALPLPVQGGTVRERFGMAIPGGQTSQGVRFAVSRGSAVRAVAPGRVAYADWLKGYGLLLILDHGGGWMSLYAHGDRLERSVGDWVRAGDLVARAGSSGGGDESALYFELRRNGRPVDPRGWWR